MAWFKSRPREQFTNRELENALRSDYLKLTGIVFGDPTRTARKLYEMGRIQRSPKGTEQHFWFDPELDSAAAAEEFNEKEIQLILERDGYSCAICKKGARDGISVSVGYAMSTKRGGKLDVANGRVLCPRHKFILETAQDSEDSGANFRKLRKLLPEIGNSSAKGIKFWEDFFDLLLKYGIDPTK